MIPVRDAPTEDNKGGFEANALVDRHPACRSRNDRQDACPTTSKCVVSRNQLANG